MPLRGLLFQSLVLAVLVTWPALVDPTGDILGSPKGDAVKHVWNLWWMRHELLHGTFGLQTNVINFPVGLELYPIEIANGFLTAWLPLPPVLTSNLLALGHVFLIGVCTGWLGWLVGARRAGAHVAGALAQTSAFTAFTLHAGVGELRQAWWVPLGLAVAVRARDHLRLRDFALLGLTTSAATLSCFYHGFFLATAVALYAACTLSFQRRFFAGWGIAAAITLCIVVPTVHVFSASYGVDERTQMSFYSWMLSGLPTDSHPVTSLQFHELFAADYTGTTDLDKPFEAYLGGRYLGAITVLLAAVGLFTAPVRARPWAGMAVGGIVLALGNVVWFGGHVVDPPLLLPLAVINKALAYFAQPLNFPVRYLCITTTAMAVLASLSVRWRWPLFLTPLAMLDMTLNDPAPWPRSTFQLEGHDDIVAPEGAVAELSWAPRADTISNNQDPLTIFDASIRARSTAAQIFLDRPFQTIAIERVDHWAVDGITWTAATPLARSLAGNRAVDARDVKASIYLLWERGFRSIWISHACTGDIDIGTAQKLTSLLGKPRHGRCGDLWVIPPQPEPAGLTEFRARFAKDLALVPKPALGEPVNNLLPDALHPVSPPPSR